jgi:hypothetical protein
MRKILKEKPEKTKSEKAKKTEKTKRKPKADVADAKKNKKGLNVKTFFYASINIFFFAGVVRVALRKLLRKLKFPNLSSKKIISSVWKTTLPPLRKK